MIKKTIETNHYTPQDIKLAYQLVEVDLLNSLTNLETGDSIRLGKLGKFVKSAHVVQSALKDYEGETFVYGKIKFKPFSRLKSVLNTQALQNYKLNVR